MNYEKSMESDGFKSVVDSYRSERPIYEIVCRGVEARLKAKLHAAGIRCTTSSRPKDLASLLRKVMKGRAPTDIRDKAGARAIVTYDDQIEPAKEVIRDSFHVIKEDDKRETLSASELAYLGVHFDVEMREEDWADDPRCVGRLCEIQLHTRAQNVWAEVSHDLVYKTGHDITKNIERRIMRLEALVEIFDEEVTRARQAILSEPGLIEARMLYTLEPYFVRFGGENFDQALSIDLLALLRKTLDADEATEFITLISRFVEQNEQKLEMLFRTHIQTQPPNPLLLQPEALLIYERLNTDRFKLLETWASHYPVSLLRSFSEEWGIPLPEIG